MKEKKIRFLFAAVNQFSGSGDLMAIELDIMND
jgi:hypothetical protein